MKKLVLVVVALAAGALVVGRGPDSVVDATQSVVGVVADQPGEMGAEQRFEEQLDLIIDRSYSLLDEPLCDARVVPGTSGEDLEVSSLECRIATVKYGAVDVTAELRGQRAVLLVVDSDTDRLIEIIDDPSLADWLPLVDPTA